MKKKIQLALKEIVQFNEQQHAIGIIYIYIYGAGISYLHIILACVTCNAGIIFLGTIMTMIRSSLFRLKTIQVQLQGPLKGLYGPTDQPASVETTRVSLWQLKARFNIIQDQKLQRLRSSGDSVARRINCVPFQHTFPSSSPSLLKV